MTDELELICFQIISSSGMAKTCYIEALRAAKKGNEELTRLKVEEASNFFVQGHKIHAELIQKEAAGQSLDFSLILMHAEDQMASVETVKLLSEELIELYLKKSNEAGQKDF
ncbi:PTS system cellobiose-specific IIA component [Streptococcus rupicaprae]|uniref:PTS system cellobiose-specific IIA component n=1 Tax=Streptococcus rupicaprae TaxID=759619 RepID=A0ABV2FIK4_9STRE